MAEDVNRSIPDITQRLAPLWRMIVMVVVLAIMALLASIPVARGQAVLASTNAHFINEKGDRTSPLQVIEAVALGKLNPGAEQMPPAQVGQEIVIDFDQDASGNDIPHLEVIDNEYAALGIHFQGGFRAARRVLCFPNYKNTTTLNLLSTFVSTEADPANCGPIPPGGVNSRLVANLDFPVDFASIEGRTRADGVFDGDLLVIEAFDAGGNFLTRCDATGTNDPPPHTTEGLLVCEVNAPGIRRLVVNPVDTDALDTLRLRAETPVEETDLAVAKTDSPDPVNAGNNLTYTIEVTNSGPTTATNVIFTDTLPAGVSFVSATPSQGTCSFDAANNAVLCDLGVLASPAVATSTFDENDEDWTVVGGALGPNYFPAGGNPGGYISAVDQVTDIFWYWQAPSKFLGDVSAAHGHMLTFDLRQSNTSDQDTAQVDIFLEGASLTLTFDTSPNPGTDWTAYTILMDETAGWEVLGTGIPPTLVQMLDVLSALTDLRIRGEYRFGANTGDLDNVVLNRAPAFATITVVVTVDPSTADGTVLTNSAEVMAAEPDRDPSNNVATEDTTVRSEADLAIIKADSPDPVNVGDNLSYTLEVSNNGPSDATDVIMTDVLPTGVTFVSSTPDPPTCTESGGMVTCDLDTMASGANESVSIVVTVEISAAVMITNTASVTATEPDPDPSNNTAIEDTTIRPTAIELISFFAKAGADHITLIWETASELDNEGFNLWRSQAADGEYTRLNTSLIPAQGNADTGASYEHTDTAVVKGVTYYYKLEDVDIHGASSFHGPVSATPSQIQRIYLPLILK